VEGEMRARGVGRRESVGALVELKGRREVAVEGEREREGEGEKQLGRDYEGEGDV